MTVGKYASEFTWSDMDKLWDVYKPHIQVLNFSKDQLSSKSKEEDLLVHRLKNIVRNQSQVVYTGFPKTERKCDKHEICYKLRRFWKFESTR